MRHPAPILAVSLVALLAAAPVAARRETAPLSDTARAALKDYEPVGTTSCIPLRSVESTRIVDPSAIIYKVSSRKLYVNQPDDGRCTALRKERALVTRTMTGNLCRMDIVRVIDPPTPIEYGSCILGDFTEYRRRN